MTREILLALALLAAPLAGCLAGEDPDAADDEPAEPASANVSPSTGENETAEPGNGTEPAPDEPANTTPDPPDVDPRDNVTLEDGRAHVDTPVHVALVGFPEDAAEGLSERLEATPVDHRTVDLPAIVRPDQTPPVHTGGDASRPLPIVPVANYTVHHLPDVGEAFRDRLDTWTVDANASVDVYDAGAVEAWLAEALPEAGVPVEASTPTLVLLHEGNPGGHAYRYSYASGHLQPVRAFGGEEPLLALDVSARTDPFVTRMEGCTAPTSGEGCAPAWDRPLPSSGEAAEDALAAAVDAATRYRLLQGALYPPATAPCTAVTVVLAVDATATTELHPDMPAGEALLDADRLQRSLDAAAGDRRVLLETKVLELPVDDPGLDAATETENYRAVRAWLTEHWSDYWVAREGCEAAVSLHVLGDANERRNWGVALHDAERGYRASLSVTAGLDRALAHQDATEGVVSFRNDTRGAYELVDHLVAHETGHLLGLRHPHDVSPNGDARGHVWTFSSTRTAMSYQVQDRTVQLGAIDQANLARNRAGELLREALAHHEPGSPELEAALTELGTHDWADAADRLQGLTAAS